MAFTQLIYFYLVLLSFLINPQDVVSRKQVREPIETPFSATTSPSISAVLLECPNVQRRASSSRPDCERQMMVHIRVGPTFQIESLDKFLLLDEVHDQRRQTKAKLMSPYLIEVSRGEPVIMYPLQFSKSIRCDTCGHKSENNTNVASCAESLDNSESNIDGLNKIPGSSFAPVHPSRQATELHRPRCTQEQNIQNQELESQKQSQHQNGDKAPIEKTPVAGENTPEKTRTAKKISIGIMEPFPLSVQPKSPSDVDEHLAFSDMTQNEADDIGDDFGMEYDVDDYDEHNLNEDTLQGRGVEAKFRDKRLKVDDALSKNEKLFRAAERQSEEARINTIKAFRTKHENTNIGTSSIASRMGKYGIDAAGHGGSSSWRDLVKPHIGERQEARIRPRKEYGSNEDDDVKLEGKLDGNNSPVNKRAFGNNKHSLTVDRMKKKHPKTNAFNQNKSKWSDVKYTESKHKGSLSSSNRDNAFSSPSKTVLQSTRHWQHQPLQEESADSSEDSTRRKFSQGEDSESIGSNGDEDYERGVDASAHGVPVIESKSNIARIDNVGGMSDEFYWNTLHYPEGNKAAPTKRSKTKTKVTTSNAAADGIQSHGIESGKSHVSSNDDDTVSNQNKDLSPNMSSMRHIKLSNELNKMQKAKTHGVGMANNERNLSNDQRTDYDNFQSRTPLKTGRNDKKPEGNNANIKTGLKASDKFSHKSAKTKTKVRSSNTGLHDGPGVDSNVDPVVDPGDDAIDVPPVYTYEDVLPPVFPLNNYPGYAKVKASSEFELPQPFQSHFSILENAPSHYIPDQPPFAKELGDPNLTVNEKINLLQVLTADDKQNEEAFRKLQSELDKSLIIHDINNHDRMPLPAKIAERIKNFGGIKKRSSVVYDDLTMRDAYDQYDDFDGVRVVDPSADSDVRDASDDAALCKTCNGKQCHSHSTDGSRNCVCERGGRNCKCTEDPEKKIRSVTDAWYSVFNMSAPLQFLTTRVQIYRKRHGTWWKIAPSVTLTSLSGIYANGNLSILFSSHVDIFQLRRPFTIENHKLLVPHDGDDVSAVHSNPFETIDPSDILAIDSTKFDFNAIHDDDDDDDDEDDAGSNRRKDDQQYSIAKRSLCNAAISVIEHGRRRRSHSFADPVLSIEDLGYFPVSMNILEKCPSNPKHLCLNMLGDEVPAFTVRIKQPFLENALIYEGMYKLRIAAVISDATTKGALQVAVIIINEYYVPHEFAVSINDCPMTCGAKTTVRKDLAPHVSETVSFLLPFEENKAKKLQCKVEVKSPDQKVISERKFIVEATARCLCIWDCDCYCIESLASYDDYDVCHKLTSYEESAAGFIEGNGVRGGMGLTGWQWFCWRMSQHALVLLLCMLFLGFLKAILGAFGLRRIDKCGYDYVQPLQRYEYASRCRRFFINILFFIVLPFIFCCMCFTPTEEDLLTASTEWQCSLLQKEISDDSSGDSGDDSGGNANNGSRWKFFGRFSKNRKERGGCNVTDDDDDDDEETILSQHFESVDGSQSARMRGSQGGYSQYLIETCDYDEDEEERDTNYVLQALTESRESIRKLLNSHWSGDLDPNNPLTKEAEELVRRLVAAKIVYRTFQMPMKNVDIPRGQKYSIQGYFVPSVGPSYQYITPSPLAQFRRISANTSGALQTPLILRPDEFSRIYTSKLEVLEAGDLSVDPPEDAPCINRSNTCNETQLTTASTLQTAPSPRATPTPTSAGGSAPITNDVVTDHGSVYSNDNAARSGQIDDANNRSTLSTQRNDSPGPTK